MRLLLLILVIGLCACKKESSQPTVDKKVVISVTNFPLKWLAENLLSDKSLVHYPIPPDIDPAFWEPTKEDLQKLMLSKKIFFNGATYEKWQETAALPKSKLIDTTESLKGDYIVIKDAVKHEHDGDTHSHDGTAFTTWLQEEFMLKQLNAISSELQIIYPDKANSILLQEKKLTAKLKELYLHIDASFKNKKKFLASHPIYQYLSKDQDLEIVSFLWEPDTMPSAEQWKELINKKGHSPYMLWEDTPTDEIAEKLHRAGIKIIVFRQCGNIPPSNDYIIEMQQNLSNLNKILHP